MPVVHMSDQLICDTSEARDTAPFLIEQAWNSSCPHQTIFHAFDLWVLLPPEVANCIVLPRDSWGLENVSMTLISFWQLFVVFSVMWVVWDILCSWSPKLAGVKALGRAEQKPTWGPKAYQSLCTVNLFFQYIY